MSLQKRAKKNRESFDFQSLNRWSQSELGAFLMPEI